MLRSLSRASIVQILYCMESMASDYESGTPDATDYEFALRELQTFVSLTLRPGDLLTVALPDGQTVEIDARDPSAVTVFHVDLAGNDVATLEVEPEPEPDGPHPSLSAAERNPSMV